MLGRVDFALEDLRRRLGVAEPALPHVGRAHDQFLGRLADILKRLQEDSPNSATQCRMLADKLARDCRSIMMRPWYQRIFQTRLAPHRHAVQEFITIVRATGWPPRPAGC